MKNNTQPTTKPTHLKCIQDLFDLAGSAKQIALDLNLHQVTVERWRIAGVPEKYDKVLSEKYGATPFELRMISKRARKSITSPTKCAKV